jgi:hypothetical protein
MRRFEAALREFGAREPLARELHSDEPARNRRELGLLVNQALPAAKQVARSIADGQRAAISQVAQVLGERSPSEAARDTPKEFRAALAAAGFDVDGWSSTALKTFAERQIAALELEKALLKGNLRAEVARATDLSIGAVSSQSVLDCVRDDRERAKWLSELLERAAAVDVAPRLLMDLAVVGSRQRALSRAVGDSVPGEQYFLGISPQSRWLVTLSFLVCAVGVANAMLMSVTERFTEIATMKCLGALDGFVMTMFLLEAVIEGGIGGAVGLGLGALLAWLRGLVEYGSVLSAAGATGHLLSGLGLSLVAGMVLAALAAVGPSFVAARLAPMEAMRVD